MNRMKITLCSKCAICAGTEGLRQLTRMKDKKVKCDRCGRMRYGAEYELVKEVGDNPSVRPQGGQLPLQGSHERRD